MEIKDKKEKIEKAFYKREPVVVGLVVSAIVFPLMVVALMIQLVDSRIVQPKAGIIIPPTQISASTTIATSTTNISPTASSTNFVDIWENIQKMKNQQIQETPPNVGNNTADIVAEWQDRVAQVTCYLKQNGVDVTSQGSATLLNSRYADGSVAMTAITNAHVITGDYNVALCIFGVYGKGSRLVTDQTALMFGTTEDYAYINLDKASKIDETTWKSVVSKNMKICSDSRVNKGDELLVLGYPGIGTVGGLTVTKGIISGIEKNYFVTDAKIDHGNSGGTAILIKDDCYLGIPSASKVGEIESMGRILKASFVIGL
jgi:S1-C subfamily serine protease